MPPTPWNSFVTGHGLDIGMAVPIHPLGTGLGLILESAAKTLLGAGLGLSNGPPPFIPPTNSALPSSVGPVRLGG